MIDNIVDAYARVYANLKVHNPNYPSPVELKSKIKWGNVEFEGDYSKDTGCIGRRLDVCFAPSSKS